MPQNPPAPQLQLIVDVMCLTFSPRSRREKQIDINGCGQTGGVQNIFNWNQVRMGKVQTEVENGILRSRPDLRLMLAAFLRDFDVSWGKELSHFGSTVNAFLLRPQSDIKRSIGLDKEIMLIHQQYAEIQPRIFNVAQRIMSNAPFAGRVEPLMFILVSPARDQEKAVAGLQSDASIRRILIPFEIQECCEDQGEYFIQERFSKYLFSRDLFDMSRPLGSNLYFFGRNPFVIELRDSIGRGENVGLFGLRRTGKTSLLLRLQRLLLTEGSRTLVYVDLEDQALYQMRWWELLFFVAIQCGFSDAEQPYSETDAAARFRKHIESIKRRRKSYVVAFDEIEHITPGKNLRMKAHWDFDFIELWKTLRAIQNVNSHICFVVCGTNASPLETARYSDRDNPLFGMASVKYIPAFTAKETAQMVQSLGKYMGLRFTDSGCAYLADRYGGHPYITRQACSFIFKALVGDAKPIVVDGDELLRTQEVRELSLFQYAEYMLGVLRQWYKDEYALLEYLAIGQSDVFEEFEREVPSMSAHLRNYGLVGEAPPQITHKFVAAYIIHQKKRNESSLEIGVEKLHETSQTGEDDVPDEAIQQITREYIMGDKYVVSGQAGAVGPSAAASNMSFNQIWIQKGEEIDLSKLSAELEQLRLELSKDATTAEHYVAVGALASAEIEAKGGNGSKTLELLSQSGKWALDAATKIGTTVAAGAIKTSLGI